MVSWPGEYGGRDASLIEWLIFEEEYYRAGAPKRVNQNGIFLLGPTLFEFGTPEQKERYPAADGRGRGALGAGLVGAERGQRPGRDPEPGACATASGCVLARPEDLVHARRVLPTGCSACSAATRRLERHRGLTYLLVPLDAPGRHACGRSRQLDGDDGFAEVFFDDVFVPDARRARRRGRRLEGGDGDGGLRARASRCAAPAASWRPRARLIELYQRRRAPADPALRDAVVRGWMDAEAYRSHTLPTVTRLARGGDDRRRGEPEQDLLVGARRAHARDRARACSARAPSCSPSAPAARATAAWIEGLPVRARRADLRRHQRDPAQRHRRARPRPAAGVAMRFAFTEEQLLLQKTRARPPRAPSARPSACARPGSGDGRSPDLWAKLAELGRARASSCPRPAAASASTSSTPCCCSRRPAARRSPSPSWRRPRSRAPLLAELGDPELAARWLPRVAAGEALLAVGLPRTPSSPTPHVADLLLLPDAGGELHAVPRAEARLIAQPSVDRRPAALRRRAGAAGAATLRGPGRGGAALARRRPRPRRARRGRAARRRSPAAASSWRWATPSSASSSAGRSAASRRSSTTLANALVRLEFARPLVYRAAYSVARSDPRRALHVSMAKAAAADAAAPRRAQRAPVHGAIGYTWSSTISISGCGGPGRLDLAWGDASVSPARVAGAVLAPGAALGPSTTF